MQLCERVIILQGLDLRAGLLAALKLTVKLPLSSKRVSAQTLPTHIPTYIQSSSGSQPKTCLRRGSRLASSIEATDEVGVLRQVASQQLRQPLAAIEQAPVPLQLTGHGKPVDQHGAGGRGAREGGVADVGRDGPGCIGHNVDIVALWGGFWGVRCRVLGAIGCQGVG